MTKFVVEGRTPVGLARGRGEGVGRFVAPYEFLSWNRSRLDPYVRIGVEEVVFDHLRRYFGTEKPE